MSIPAMAGNFVLKQTTAEMAQFVQTGKFGLFGSVLRDLTTGKIIGYMQETRALGAAVMLANPATATAAGVYLAGVGVHQVFDTNRTVHRIEGTVGKLSESSKRIEQGIGRVESQLGRMADDVTHTRAGVEMLDKLGMANLALSATGIGVSMAGFAAVAAKIDGVRRAVDGAVGMLHAVSAQIEDVRRDKLRADFSDLKTLAEQMDEAWLLSDSARAETQWHAVAQRAHRLQNRFAERAGNLLSAPEGYAPADPMLDAFALASGVRFSALAACNETAASVDAARDASRVLLGLTGRIGLADLARHQVDCAGVDAGTPEWALALTQASETLRPLARKLREREAALATRSAPLLALEGHGIAPREWLRIAHDETVQPVLFMSSQPD